MVADKKKTKVHVPVADPVTTATAMAIDDGDPNAGTSSSSGGAPTAHRVSTSGGTKRSAEPVGAASPGQRRLRHTITGVNKAFRDSVSVALTELELTKNVAELQAVMDQVTKVSVELQQHSTEQDAQAADLLQRLEASEEKVKQLEKGTTGHFKAVDTKLGKIVDDQTKVEAIRVDNREELFTKLALQEATLTSRIEEIKALFTRCDKVLVEHTEALKAGHAPAATSAAGAQPALSDPSVNKAILKEAQTSNGLLRDTINAMQVEINQLREQGLETASLSVPLELNIQEQATRNESFQQWVVKEIIECKNRHDKITKQAADAFEDIRATAQDTTDKLQLEIAANGCPCPPGCKGKAPGDTAGADKADKAKSGPAASCSAACGKGQDPWHNYPAGKPDDGDGSKDPPGKGGPTAPTGPGGGGDGGGGGG